MEAGRARALLAAERERVERLLREERADEEEAFAAAQDTGDLADPAEPLTESEVDAALIEGLRDRLAAIERAEERLRDGTFGRSIRSGLPISDERLEADPAAELTAEEAESGEG